MWTLAASLLSWVLGLFGFGKPDPEAQGVVSGMAQQKTTDQSAVIKDVQDAKAASDGVDAAIASGVPITDSDGFRRD